MSDPKDDAPVFWVTADNALAIEETILGWADEALIAKSCAIYNVTTRQALAHEVLGVDAPQMVAEYGAGRYLNAGNVDRLAGYVDDYLAGRVTDNTIAKDAKFRDGAEIAALFRQFEAVDYRSLVRAAFADIRALLGIVPPVPPATNALAALLSQRLRELEALAAPSAAPQS